MFTSPATISISLLLLLLLTFSASHLSAQSDLGIAVVVGENSAWTIEAPEGWRLEPAGAVAAGVGAAFVPEKEAWDSAPSVIYGITLPKRSGAMTIEAIMLNDSARTEQRRPGTIVTTADPIETIEGVSARVRHSTAADSSTFEAVAYIDGPTAVALVVLSSRTQEDFNASLDSFARLVDSYEWITADPAEIAEIKRYR